MKDSIKLIGRLRIFRRTSPELPWELAYEGKNLVVNTGTELMADRLKNNAVAALSHIAVGTNATPVAATDTTLGAEIARLAFTDSDAQVGSFTCETTFGPSQGNGTWRECGIFNAPSAGTMFNRINVNYTKIAGEETKTEFTITLTAS